MLHRALSSSKSFIHIFEPLVAIDGNYNARPVLASKVETSADAKVFTFALRKGVKFHNARR